MGVFSHPGIQTNIFSRLDGRNDGGRHGPTQNGASAPKVAVHAETRNTKEG